VQLSPLPELSHPLIQALIAKSDRELVNLFQLHPELGEYFVAIFCRYGQIIYTLSSGSTRSPIQGDYLFAQTWQRIYDELRSLHPEQADQIFTETSLQNWLIDIAGVMIVNNEVPAIDEISYKLATTPPVLLCYLTQAIDQLPENLRLVLLLSQTFHWSSPRIAAYLQAEGDRITTSQVNNLLDQALQTITTTLPEDIQSIYLAEQQSNQNLANQNLVQDLVVI